MSTPERKDPTDWDKLWRDGRTPWDQGGVTPALKELLEEDLAKVPDFPSTGRVLVPGCGGAHDVFYLATRGYQVVGADISPTAMDHCREEASRNGITGVELITCDFFTEDLGQFDIGFDYTFLCALPPPMRNDWGKRQAELVRPGGHLITLMFPLDASREGGPPYALTVELYHTLLDANFELVYENASPRSPAEREGKQRMAVWRRRS
ncbi:S-adenosyl-L-methionine-dependent methyltransferase [Thamnocephalis sphaerospora]|uniref:S-adenosyl-L-methionine-dependent methyltransferase n=1 Tax=Thamnocephalis sphaerospora TaxID=78915 RepID=A0A4P9XQD6_9FUNG|nr:S-adenosyl-L-methionine-dependent methyltransferase [Thamnocephalis sphaerospora]|eukprot:RKP08246.1 S-adenosyl-L-methionine-dependent methyltransferase [Thamnocephalis sphaerospora]